MWQSDNAIKGNYIKRLRVYVDGRYFPAIDVYLECTSNKGQQNPIDFRYLAVFQRLHLTCFLHFRRCSNSIKVYLTCRQCRSTAAFSCQCCVFLFKHICLYTIKKCSLSLECHWHEPCSFYDILAIGFPSTLSKEGWGNSVKYRSSYTGQCTNLTIITKMHV